MAYQARTAGSGLDGVDGWVVVATERQERATPHVGRLCVQGRPHGDCTDLFRRSLFGGTALAGNNYIPDVQVEWTEPIRWICPR